MSTRPLTARRSPENAPTRPVTECPTSGAPVVAGNAGRWRRVGVGRVAAHGQKLTRLLVVGAEEQLERTIEHRRAPAEVIQGCVAHNKAVLAVADKVDPPARRDGAGDLV